MLAKSMIFSVMLATEAHAVGVKSRFTCAELCENQDRGSIEQQAFENMKCGNNPRCKYSETPLDLLQEDDQEDDQEEKKKYHWTCNDLCELYDTTTQQFAGGNRKTKSFNDQRCLEQNRYCGMTDMEKWRYKCYEEGNENFCERICLHFGAYRITEPEPGQAITQRCCKAGEVDISGMTEEDSWFRSCANPAAAEQCLWKTPSYSPTASSCGRAYDCVLECPCYLDNCQAADFA